MENEDVGSSRFEDRIRELLADGAADRGVSASGVIRGARRRRVVHRATAAGSSLAVLGVAAGAIAFGGGGGHSGGASQDAVKPASSSTGAAAPKGCSASLRGTVPGTTTTTVDRLVFDTVSGTTAGIPWAVQIHVFPDKKSHLAWENGLPEGSIPQAAKDGEHEGAIAQFRRPDIAGYSEFGMPGGTDDEYFVIQPGGGIGTGTPAKPSEELGMPKSMPVKVFPAYVMSGWMAPDIDHLCVQYADHAEFAPVYRIQGGDFYVFGYKDSDRPTTVFGYNAAGRTVEVAVATHSGPYSLMPIRAKQALH